jgi:hypothetical protein
MENPEFILGLSEEELFRRLGEVDFQLEKYGDYNPHRIFEIYFVDRGHTVFHKYADLVKSKVCPLYESMRKSGVLDTAEKVYFFVLGFLIARDVYGAIAAGVAAVIAKQGLYSLCKESQ